jgi:hypothetical protein
MARTQSEDMLTADEACRLEAIKKRKEEVIEKIKVIFKYIIITIF